MDTIEAFCATAFGWTFTDYGEDYRAFDDGRLDGGFYKADLQSTADSGSALVVLYAEDLAQLRDRVMACEGKITKDIFAFPSGRRFQFADPTANELAVWTDRDG